MDNPTCLGITIVKHGELYLVTQSEMPIAPPCPRLAGALSYFAIYTLPRCVTDADVQEYADAVIMAVAKWGQSPAEPLTVPHQPRARFPLTPHTARVRYFLGGKSYTTERRVTVFDDGSAECILQGRQCKLRPVGDGVFEEIRSAA